MRGYSGDFLFPTDMPLYMIRQYLPRVDSEGKTKCDRVVESICDVVERIEREDARKAPSKAQAHSGGRKKPRY